MSGPITKDEEEVVETLYALAGMFPNNVASESSDKSKLDSEFLEVDPSTLPEPKETHKPVFEGFFFFFFNLYLWAFGYFMLQYVKFLVMFFLCFTLLICMSFWFFTAVKDKLIYIGPFTGAEAANLCSGERSAETVHIDPLNKPSIQDRTALQDSNKLHIKVDNSVPQLNLHSSSLSIKGEAFNFGKSSEVSPEDG